MAAGAANVLPASLFTMQIRLARTDDTAAISGYIDRRETASVYHDYGWMQVIEESFRQRCFYLVCEKSDGGIGGVLPLVHLKSLWFGNLLVSLPYFNYGGVCADDAAIQGKLVDEAIRIAEGLGAGHIEFRQESPLNRGFASKGTKISMRLPLPGGADALWESFPSKLRSQVRKPQKEGLTARISRQEGLDAFYEIFSVNMRDLGTPVYPKRFFRSILDRFPANTWICTVFSGTVPMASGFLVGFKKRLEIPWASSIRKYNPLAPNMLLYWSCLRFACERGFEVFDFGRSTAEESTYRFKEQWGARPRPMNWEYWLRDGGAPPEIHPGNPKYRLAIAAWKKLPLSVSRVLGPRIVRNIP